MKILQKRVVRTHLDIHMFNTHMYHLVEAVALYVLLRFTASDCPFAISHAPISKEIYNYIVNALRMSYLLVHAYIYVRYKSTTLSINVCILKLLTVYRYTSCIAWLIYDWYNL